MSYSLIDLSENAQDNRYPITNDFGLLYKRILAVNNSLMIKQVEKGSKDDSNDD